MVPNRAMHHIYGTFIQNSIFMPKRAGTFPKYLVFKSPFLQILSKYFFIFTFSRLYQTERWDQIGNTDLVELKSKRQK